MNMFQESLQENLIILLENHLCPFIVLKQQEKELLEDEMTLGQQANTRQASEHPGSDQFSYIPTMSLCFHYKEVERRICHIRQKIWPLRNMDSKGASKEDRLSSVWIEKRICSALKENEMYRKMDGTGKHYAK